MCRIYGGCVHAMAKASTVNKHLPLLILHAEIAIYALPLPRLPYKLPLSGAKEP